MRRNFWVLVLALAAGLWSQPLICVGRGGAAPPRAEMIGMRPAVYTDRAGHVQMVYEGYEFGARATDIIFAQSDDDAASWTGFKNLSRSSGVSKTPAIATDADDGVDVIWCDTPAGQLAPDVYFSRSDNGGKRWSRRQDVSNTPGPSGRPALAVAPDRSIHVVWEDIVPGTANPDIWYACSTDDGRTWSPAKNISNASGTSSEPSIEAGADGTVHVVWSDASNPNHPVILYSRTHDHGATWTPPRDISNLAGRSVHPDVACGRAGSVYVTWGAVTPDHRGADIFFVASHDGGATFSASINVSNALGSSTVPRVAAQDDCVAIAWSKHDAGETSDIWLATSINDGTTFTAAHNLSKSDALSLVPDVAIAKGRAVAVWESVEHGVSHIRSASEAIR